MSTRSITRTDAGWNLPDPRLEVADIVPPCIELRKNIDGTRDFSLVPLAMRYSLLLPNGGEKNEVN